MAQQYYTMQDYVGDIRIMLQDLIAPYRYPDQEIMDAVETALSEISRIRPDIFLDLKYQQPLRKGDIEDGTPSNPIAITDFVPIPNKYSIAVEWYASGWLQLYDVTDTQDQRAQAFLQKFQQHLLSVSAA